jgi:hypothetical protein
MWQLQTRLSHFSLEDTKKVREGGGGAGPTMVTPPIQRVLWEVCPALLGCPLGLGPWPSAHEDFRNLQTLQGQLQSRQAHVATSNPPFSI